MSHRSAPPPVPMVRLPRDLRLGEALRLWDGAPAAWFGDDARQVVLREDLDRALAHGLAEQPLASIARDDLLRSSSGTDVAPRSHGATALGWTVVVGSPEEYRIARQPVPLEPVRTLSARSMGRLLPPTVLDVLEDLGRFAAERGSDVLAVGGLVRDLALGLPFQDMDLDLVAEGDAIAMARAWGTSRGYEVRCHPAFGTAKCSAAGAVEVDLASMRRERYSAPGALPAVEPGSLLDDLHRRDFTANALALRLAPDRFGAVVDPFDGWGDLERGVLRIHHPLSFVDDPTRLLRSARYRARLGLSADEAHDRARELALSAGVMNRVSGARVLADLTRILLESDPRAALERLAAEKVLRAVHPALDGWARAFDRLAPVREAQSAWPERFAAVDLAIPFLAALMWDWDSSTIEHVRKRLAPPGRVGAHLELEVPRARSIAAKLGNQHAVRPSDAFRLLREVPGAVLVTIAALGGPAASSAVRRFVETSRHVAISTTGNDLRALGLEAGPIFSEIQARLRNARLDGEVHDRDSELALVRREFLGSE